MAESRTKNSRPGRPGRPKSVGERVPLGLRVTTKIKAKLDLAALESGRSQSQEAELRLEQSFAKERLVHEALDLAYGPKMTALILSLARAMQMTGTRASFVCAMNKEDHSDWMANPFAFDQAAQAARVILEAFRPDAAITAPRPTLGLSQDQLSQLGEGTAQNLLKAIRNPPKPGHMEDWIAPIRARTPEYDKP